jgi:hypothetical protein
MYSDRPTSFSFWFATDPTAWTICLWPGCAWRPAGDLHRGFVEARLFGSCLGGDGGFRAVLGLGFGQVVGLELDGECDHSVEALVVDQSTHSDGDLDVIDARPAALGAHDPACGRTRVGLERTVAIADRADLTSAAHRSSDRGPHLSRVGGYQASLAHRAAVDISTEESQWARVLRATRRPGTSRGRPRKQMWIPAAVVTLAWVDITAMSLPRRSSRTSRSSSAIRVDDV